MPDFDKICGDMIKRARAIYSLIQSVQGTLDTVDLLYDSDEDLNEHQAIAQYLWRKVLPEVEPAILEPGEGFALFLLDGVFCDRPHSWMALQITDESRNKDAYQIVIETYFPGSVPQVLLLDSDSPILPHYVEHRRWAVGQSPDDDE